MYCISTILEFILCNLYLNSTNNSCWNHHFVQQKRLIQHCKEDCGSPPPTPIPTNRNVDENNKILYKSIHFADTILQKKWIEKLILLRKSRSWTPLILIECILKRKKMVDNFIHWCLDLYGMCTFFQFQLNLAIQQLHILYFFIGSKWSESLHSLPNLYTCLSPLTAPAVAAACSGLKETSNILVLHTWNFHHDKQTCMYCKVKPDNSGFLFSISRTTNHLLVKMP